MKEAPVRLTGVLVLMAASSAVHAQGSHHCDAPPYGSTVPAFKEFIRKWTATDAQSLIPILENACRAKFEHAPRRTLYTAGLTDEEINRADPVSLADTWIRATLQSLPAPMPEVHHLYGLFFCYADCRLQGNLFETLAQCRQRGSLVSSGRPFDADGRIRLDGGSWWECRERRVDTWEPVP